LDALRAVHEEREQAEWFRTAWLAAQIPIVWSETARTPYDLLGWEDPAQESRVHAFWLAMQGRDRGH
jgi:hypothetical protein